MLKRLLTKKILGAGLVVICGATGFALPPEAIDALATGIALVFA